MNKIITNILRMLCFAILEILGFVFLYQNVLDGNVWDFRIALGVFFIIEGLIISPILNGIFLIFKKDIKWYEKLVLVFLGLLLGYSLLFLASNVDFHPIKDYITCNKIYFGISAFISLVYLILIFLLNKKGKTRNIISFIFAGVILIGFIISKSYLVYKYNGANNYFDKNPYNWKEPKVIEKENKPLNPYNFQNSLIVDNSICHNCNKEMEDDNSVVFTSNDKIITISKYSDWVAVHNFDSKTSSKVDTFNPFDKFLTKNNLTTGWEIEKFCEKQKYNFLSSSMDLYGCYYPRMTSNTSSNDFVQDIIFKDYKIVVNHVDSNTSDNTNAYYIDIVTKNNSYNITIVSKDGKVTTEDIYDFISRISFTEEG